MELEKEKQELYGKIGDKDIDLVTACIQALLKQQVNNTGMAKTFTESLIEMNKVINETDHFINEFKRRKLELENEIRDDKKIS